MMLAEVAAIPTWDLPIAAFRDHLRLGSGFGDDAVQDAVLETCLRAAIAAVEARTGKVTLERSFRWKVNAWRAPCAQALPLAPVSAITSVKLVTRLGDGSLAGLEMLNLDQDLQRPVLRALTKSLPHIPTGGRAEITFLAGFASEWSGLPADLAQAVMLLAAHYHEVRHEQPVNDGNMPFGVASLIERYRTVRILGGGAVA